MGYCDKNLSLELGIAGFLEKKDEMETVIGIGLETGVLQNSATTEACCQKYQVNDEQDYSFTLAYFRILHYIA